MLKFGSSVAIVLGAMMMTSTAHAKCTSPVAKDDLTNEQIVEIYDCIKDELRAGYASGDNAWAKDYVNWGAAATQPLAPGTHGNRFLMTFVNEIGFAEYVKYSEERANNPVPVGTLIAKESFQVNKKNEVKKGPLFFMEKVAAGNADEFGNWVYSAVRPNGKVMKVKQKFCHDCHAAYSDQDNLGYPDPEVRLQN